MRILNFRRREDAQRTLSADGLARSVLADRTKRSPSDLRFVADRNGKPRLKGEDIPSFSLSHSGDWIVCAVGKAFLGVDVEEIRPFDPETAEEFLSEEECRNFDRQAGPFQRKTYFQTWTLKESYAKAVGLGLGLSFRDISVRFARSGRISLRRNGRPLRNAFFRWIMLDDRHGMSACSLGERLPKNVIRWDISRLLRLDRREPDRTIRTE